jgi:Tfp pilus assembly protein PilF
VTASISAALIVRDEAALLPECIESIRPFVDEICIVDTGSIDGTIELACECADVFQQFPWSGDFSAARNASIDLCTRDWIFVVDADERIDPLQGPSLRELAAGQMAAYRIITRNYTNNSDLGEFTPCAAGDLWAHGFKGWHPSRKVRLFPRRPSIRFEGAVHELVEHALIRDGMPVGDSALIIHHYPELKSAADLRKKRELYIALGKAKVNANPSDARAHAELGHLYAELGDYANAAVSLREAVRHDSSRADLFKDLGGVLHAFGRDAEAVTALQIAIQLDDTCADAWRNLGVVSLAQGNAADAVPIFRKALSLNPKWHDGHRYLSVALERSGKLEEAAGESRRAVELAPGDAQAVDLFRAQMAKLKRTQEAEAILGA